MQVEQMYTLNEVAEISKVTRRTLYKYLKTGKLKANKVNGNSEWRVRESDLEKFLEGRK